MKETVSYKYWLALNPRGQARLTVKEPVLGRHERAMRLILEVPKSVFDTPVLQAKIMLPEGPLEPPQTVVDIDRLHDVIKSEIGLDVSLHLAPVTKEQTP
jgi:hypothetical protein